MAVALPVSALRPINKSLQEDNKGETIREVGAGATLSNEPISEGLKSLLKTIVSTLGNIEKLLSIQANEQKLIAEAANKQIHFLEMITEGTKKTVNLLTDISNAFGEQGLEGRRIREGARGIDAQRRLLGRPAQPEKQEPGGGFLTTLGSYLLGKGSGTVGMIAARLLEFGELALALLIGDVLGVPEMITEAQKLHLKGEEMAKRVMSGLVNRLLDVVKNVINVAREICDAVIDTFLDFALDPETAEAAKRWSHEATKGQAEYVKKMTTAMVNLVKGLFATLFPTFDWKAEIEVKKEEIVALRKKIDEAAARLADAESENLREELKHEEERLKLLQARQKINEQTKSRTWRNIMARVFELEDMVDNIIHSLIDPKALKEFKDNIYNLDKKLKLWVNHWLGWFNPPEWLKSMEAISNSALRKSDELWGKIKGIYDGIFDGIMSYLDGLWSGLKRHLGIEDDYAELGRHFVARRVEKQRKAREDREQENAGTVIPELNNLPGLPSKTPEMRAASGFEATGEPLTNEQKAQIQSHAKALLDIQRSLIDRLATVNPDGTQISVRKPTEEVGVSPKVGAIGELNNRVRAAEGRPGGGNTVTVVKGGDTSVQSSSATYMVTRPRPSHTTADRTGQFQMNR